MITIIGSAIVLSCAWVALLLTPHPAPVPAPAPAPCVQEDGSTPGQSFPCEWDAAVRGNGQGVSFTLDGPAA